MALASCGGGGGGGGAGGGGGTNNQGSLAIADVDIDNDGLIEITTLEQLDWVRNDLAGTALRDRQGRTNSTGCPTGGCNGYELAANLNFDTNADGVLSSLSVQRRTAQASS